MRFNNLPSVFKPARSSQLDSASRKTPKSRKLGLEGLEDRRLLSVSTAEFEAGSIFDDILQGGDRYKKFSPYLSEKSYKTYIKK